MNIKKFYLTAFLVILFSQNVKASENHGKDHGQIYHAFTLDADYGKSQTGKANY